MARLAEFPSDWTEGYASRSRFRAMAGPVVRHAVVSVVGSMGRLLCSGGWAIVGNGGGKPCRECLGRIAQEDD